MAGVGDSFRPRDATAIDSPPQKKPNIETDDTEAKADEDEEETKPILDSLYFGGKLIRYGGFLDEPECNRQRDLFYKQLKESQGFDVDWPSFDYGFAVINFDWDPYLDDKRSNKELIELLIQSAIKEYDEENGTQLKYDKYVSANVTPCRGHNFYITFLATDLKLSNQEPKAYQAKVCKFREEISVTMVRVKPKELSS